MSITFSLDIEKFVKIKNKNFNESEPEDEFYNPRFLEEPIYPELNVSNANAAMLFKALEIQFEYAGSILNRNLDDFLFKIEKCRQKLLNKTLKDFDENDSDYILARLSQLDKVARYAAALNANLVWS